MKKIENRGGVLSGYVPDLPGKRRKTWRNAVSYFNAWNLKIKNLPYWL